MSTPITMLPHRDHPRHFSQPNNLPVASLLQLKQSESFQLQHYGIFLVQSGEVKLQADFQRWYLKPGQYLILNADQPLTLAPQHGQPAELLCFFLAPDTMQQAATLALQKEEDPALDGCLRPEGEVELCERLGEMDGSLLGRTLEHWLQRFMRSQTADRQALAIHQDMSDEIAQDLIYAQVAGYQQMLQLTSAKLSTKRELYRRLCQARMYMHTHLDEALDLDTLAQVACLSKYHFIRLFKEAFGQTPRQYLIARRLERARTLLIHTPKTFHEICHEVGLKDSSSFGRLFKRSFGATPHLYRQQHAS